MMQQALPSHITSDVLHSSPAEKDNNGRCIEIQIVTVPR